MKPAVAITCFLLLTFSGMGFRDGIAPLKKYRLIFHNKVGSEDLVLGNTYTTILGEKITVQKFKYYLSNFSVTDTRGNRTLLPVQYFLVDEADSLSRTISLDLPDIPLKNIEFLLGVDSIKNVSGVQTGTLDPLKGMFWTWNSGYIMAKLEGSSESSTSAGHYFTYHIGGFKKDQNTTRMIQLDLTEKEEPLHELHITADINQWFKSRAEIRTAEIPVCHSPGPLAMKIADNYSTMFSLNRSR